MQPIRVAFMAILLLAGLGTEARAQTVSTFFRQPLNIPRGLAFDGSGNLYIANIADSTISVIAPGGAQSFVTQPGTNIYGAIAVDAAGDIYVADDEANAIVKIAPSGAATVVAGPTAGIDGPAGLALDGDGNLYVSNFTAGSISRITPAGAVSTLVASGALFHPMVLAAGASGDLYVFTGIPLSDGEDNSGVAKIDPTGTVTLLRGGGVLGLAVSSNGNLYLSDGNSITELSPTGALIGNFASGASPWCLAAGPDGSLYFSAQDGYDPTLDGFGYAETIDRLDATGAISQIVADPLPLANGLVAAPGGGFYVADPAGTVDKISAAGVLAPFATVAAPSAMATDKAGDLYVSSSGGGISKVAPDGTVSLVTNSYSGPLAFDSQDDLYIGAQNGNDAQILQLTSAGTAHVVATIPNGGGPVSLAIDTLGNFYLSHNGHLDDGHSSAPAGTAKVTPAGVVTAVSSRLLYFLTPASDGSVLYSDLYGSVGRLAPDGSASTIALPPTYAFPQGMALDAQGNIYLLNSSVYELSLPPSPLASAVLPGERSVGLDVPASVFASVVNAGSADLADCSPSVPSLMATTTVPTMTYQATDPATNAPIREPNRPVPIPAGGSRSFALTFAATSDGGSFYRLPVLFDCAGVSPAPAIDEISTVDLNISDVPVPDLIALAVTMSGDGIVTVPLSQGGAGAFALASINDGKAETLTVSANTGVAALPITVLICQTNPSTAQCLAPPAASVSAAYSTNGTATFSVFITANGAVPFDPAAARIFMTFADSTGAVYGWTSVAVRTR